MVVRRNFNFVRAAPEDSKAEQARARSWKWLFFACVLSLPSLSAFWHRRVQIAAMLRTRESSSATLLHFPAFPTCPAPRPLPAAPVTAAPVMVAQPYPQQGYPQQGYPQQAYPAAAGAGYPQQTYVASPPGVVVVQQTVAARPYGKMPCPMSCPFCRAAITTNV